MFLPHTDNFVAVPACNTENPNQTLKAQAWMLYAPSIWFPSCPKDLEIASDVLTAGAQGQCIAHADIVLSGFTGQCSYSLQDTISAHRLSLLPHIVSPLQALLSLAICHLGIRLAAMDPQFTMFSGAHHFRVDQQTNNFIAGNQYVQYVVNMQEGTPTMQFCPIFSF